MARVPSNTMPKDWTVPLILHASGKIRHVQLIPKDNQVFKFQNMVAQIHVPIVPHDWFDTYYPGILEPLKMRFDIKCKLHFSYVKVPLAIDHEGDPGWKRITYVGDYGIAPAAERSCPDLTRSLPQKPPYVNFHGFVDTQTFPLATNDQLSLDKDFFQEHPGSPSKQIASESSNNTADEESIAVGDLGDVTPIVERKRRADGEYEEGGDSPSPSKKFRGRKKAY
ncbi:hypothetical protein F4782DRAFT_552875 [Xylaria castorea]|nr:hypothetical protein F4782DRAFT_552875 [Xylaria castorea]